MEFDISRRTFLEAVQKTLGIVEKKTTMPILNNVLIKTDGPGLTIAATDREISLVASYDADVISPGEITLSAKKMAEMLREIQGDLIHFRASEQHLVTMTCEKLIYRIPGIAADEFPRMADVPDDMVFYPLQAEVLRELIRKTAFAMSQDEARKTLNAVYLETVDEETGKRIKMVATDGHRLATCQFDLEGPFFEIDGGIIIPRKGIMEIRKLVEEEEGQVAIGIQQGMFTVKTVNAVLKVSLIEGEYPDYRRIIPAEEEVTLCIAKDQLLHALRRMNVMSSDRYNGVIMTLFGNKIVLNSNNPDVGEANDEIEVAYEGKEITIGYNVNYILEAVEAIDEDTMEFTVGVGMKPSKVKPVGSDRYLCIVMPLRF
jgi:DNA polymerase III subunit beta